MRANGRSILLLLAVGIATAALALAAAGAGPVVIAAYRATAHPMRYHLALPVGWSAAQEWPVRVIAGADHGPLAEAVLAWCDSLCRAGNAHG